MSKRIQTYQDLLDEKQQMEVLLHAQKELVLADLREIKEELQPARDVLAFVGKVTTRDRSNVLLSMGSDKLIDWVVKKLILAKAGWLTRLVVPYLLKNYSSHIVSDNKDKIFKKVFSWLGIKKNMNGKAPTAGQPTDEQI
jgi:hypothetical protein